MEPDSAVALTKLFFFSSEEGSIVVKSPPTNRDQDRIKTREYGDRDQTKALHVKEK